MVICIYMANFAASIQCRVGAKFLYMRNDLFYVKQVGELTQFLSATGEPVSKRNVVLATFECKVNERGVFPEEQEFGVNIYGANAESFGLISGTLVAATLVVSTYVKDNEKNSKIRLLRYCPVSM